MDGRKSSGGRAAGPEPVLPYLHNVGYILVPKQEPVKVLNEY